MAYYCYLFRQSAASYSVFSSIDPIIQLFLFLNQHNFNLTCYFFHSLYLFVYAWQVYEYQRQKTGG